MKISLILPVHNAYRYVKKAISSILKNFDFDNGDVLIVDDYSDKRTAKLLDRFVSKYPEKLKMIRNSSNLGYLKSCNLAVSHVNGDIAVLLNSDCEIPKDFVSRIVNCFTHDANIVAASPIASWSANYYLGDILPLEIMNYLLKKRMKAQYPDIFNAEGFCFCVRKAYIDKYGLFDTVYGMGYCEEVDFCIGATSRGFRCVLIDNLYIKHARNKSFGSSRIEALAANNKILYEKWADFINSDEIKPVENPMDSIIREVFGVCGVYILFLLRFNRQIETNRIRSLKNILKTSVKKNNSTKKVVYTAIVGDSDIMPVVHDYVREGWQYVCFTDNKTLQRLAKFGQWEIRPLLFNVLDDTKNARWHKTHPLELFPGYAESLWVDANFNILTSYIFDLIENTRSELLVPKHYCRVSIYQEIAAVSALSREYADNVRRIEQFLKSESMPDNFGLNETNLVYRKHTAKVKKLMDDWWYMIENFSKRDPLSFSYVLWKNSVDIEGISIPNARIDVKNFKIFTHNPKDTITGKLLSFIFPSK